MSVFIALNLVLNNKLKVRNNMSIKEETLNIEDIFTAAVNVIRNLPKDGEFYIPLL